jgi:DNA-binding winged helix-turn-helix (wHTH) protein
VSAIRFGAFELDLGRRQLIRAGNAVHISPKAFRLLEVLIEKRPNAISKKDLHDQIWPETFVSEATLASLIAELREALQDDSKSPLFIRTAFAFGYAFCGEASPVESKPIRTVSALVEWNGQQAALADGENVIGRDPAVAVFIDDATVSRHHARLTIGTERVTLEDLGSKNGTFANGKQIATMIDLEDGSEFHVGGVKLVFRRNPFGKSTITLVRSRADGP